MTSQTKRRMTDNEAMFRKRNEKVEKGLAKLEKKAKEEGYGDIVEDDDKLKLQFYCECSDENCTERVEMSVKKYRSIHADRRQFIIASGHQSASVEDIVTEKNGYSIVEKDLKPSENPKKLRKTPTDNS